MFFSADLLSIRESGFGLLWLAATLGSKSTFKKLPRRSVLTADISQLCEQIVEPQEPLALRLSSNLMVGVARVYKVKQEIFFSDVTTCFNSLKKVVQDMQSTSGVNAQLQMAQPTVRSSALTLETDPRAALALEFDGMVADWDEYLNIADKSGSTRDDDEDGDFDPTGKAKQKRKKSKDKAVPQTENVRADMYTLQEHHDLLLSSSFDLSFHGSGGAAGPSSSQPDGFAFDDNFFGPNDGLDVGIDLGDELARELGEGWGGSPRKDNAGIGLEPLDLDLGLGGFDMDFAMDMNIDAAGTNNENIGLVDVENKQTPRSKRKAVTSSDKENIPPRSLRGSLTPRSILSPTTSFSRLLLSQDDGLHPLLDITARTHNHPDRPAARKPKKLRLLLDARTELTDEELKTARSQYLQGQDALRREMDMKKLERDSGKTMESMLWGVPTGIHAPALVEFWQENFKVQVEARSGALHIHMPDEPPTKRRRVCEDQPDSVHHGNTGFFDEGVMDVDMLGGGDLYEDGNPDRMRSSEDPGQGRRMSRPPSVLGDFGLDFGTQDALVGSQRSSLFPWDNAGPSSSSGAVPFGFPGGSDRMSVDRVEVRLRGSSASRRESSVIPGHIGSGGGFSPAVVGRASRLSEDDFAFEVPADNSMALESQQSELNLVTLERNSFNFLEYTKMQYQTLGDSDKLLSFETIVPTATSTRHVAAAAFYHCLVLATKDLIHLRQPEPYGIVGIIIA